MKNTTKISDDFSKLVNPAKATQICVGTGLIAFDSIYQKGTPQELSYYAGGSCGNVLSILAYLGWNSFPIARFSNSDYSAELIKDLEFWGVKTDFISISESGSTPVIFQKITKYENGTTKHVFQQKCPNCKTWLPRYRPVTLDNISLIHFNLPDAKVFYFDRLAPSSLLLAKLYKEKGATIFFEPSSIKEEKNFFEALKLCDIIKFSDDRLGAKSEYLRRFEIPLLIETKGSRGLKYSVSGKEWNSIVPIKKINIEDSAGCGDWFSAGLIHALSYEKGKKIETIDKNTWVQIFNFCQSLSSLNCFFEGARTVMYSLNKKLFWNTIEKVSQGDFSGLEGLKIPSPCQVIRSDMYPCPSCADIIDIRPSIKLSCGPEYRYLYA